jgi:hypothetical protein
MAEPYRYSREEVSGANGQSVGTALFRRARGVAGGTGGAPEWEFRGTRGRIQNYERSAAGRGAARNQAYNRNYRVNRAR